MQQADNQHLDFLISQYVDGTLEGAGKKSVEQKMLLDPAARALYDDHRETQDLLDDWGNRLPMIDWNEFDSKFAAKLDEQAREQERVSIFRRRLKPVAAAAALLLAASVGYGWHALSHNSAGGAQVASGVAISREMPHASVVFLEGSGTKPSQSSLTVIDGAGSGLDDGIASTTVNVSIPEDAVALQSLQGSVDDGFRNVKDIGPAQSPPSAVFADQFGNQKNEKDTQLPR